MSAEADIHPLHAPELAGKIEGALGEGSRFHDTDGHHAQGVGLETAVLSARSGGLRTTSSLQRA